MKTSQVGLNLIEEFEGLILQAYDDANDRVVSSGDTVRGTLTIGYGHTTSAGPPKVYPGQTITEKEANELLANDLALVEKDVNSLVKVPLNQNQFDALVSFHYNTGGLGKSTLLRKLNQKDYTGAAEEFGNWIRGNGQVLQGLVRRRKAERELFLKPYAEPPVVPTVTIVASGVAAATQTAHWWPYALIGAGLLLCAVVYAYRKYHVAKT